MMALTAGSSATASDFNNLKDRIKAEITNAERRVNYSFTFSDTNVTASNQIKATEANNLINVLRTINASTTNFATVGPGSPLNAIAQLSSALTIFEACPYRKSDGTGSGCSSGCVGLCQSCTGNCTGGCNGCSGCGGCGSGCAGSCWGGCAGCGGDCDGNCYGYCGGYCGGAGPI